MRHASTSATRAFAFPRDESLDERGRAAAARLKLPRSALLSSPAKRCLQTAEAAGLDVDAVDARLNECEFGSWGGQRLAEIDPGDWMTDPDATPHGGESLRAFAARVAEWLDEQAALDGTATAITHGGVVKAAVVHALHAPLEAFWRVDVAPLSVTELHSHGGRWTLTRTNA